VEVCAPCRTNRRRRESRSPAHARRKGYTGRADWKVIRDVKQAVRMPVTGNGDINSPEDAMRMLQGNRMRRRNDRPRRFQ